MGGNDDGRRYDSSSAEEMKEMVNALCYRQSPLDSVWIVRDNKRGLYNPVVAVPYTDGTECRVWSGHGDNRLPAKLRRALQDAGYHLYTVGR